MSEITSDLCRLCLKESFTLHNIYSSHTTSGDVLYRVLNYVYDLEITPDDGLLTQICAPCMWKMLEFEGYKRNVHFAKVEIVKMLRQLRSSSTGGCGSRESDERPIESDSAQEVPTNEEIEIEEWQMPKELKREAVDIQGYESEFPNERNIVNVDNGSSALSKVSTGSSDSKISLGLEASVGSVVNWIEGESICITEDNSLVIAKRITEEFSRDDEEESTSADHSTSILYDKETELSHLKTPLSKRKSGFVCDVCEKYFARKDHLANHVRVHNDERPFRCNVCKKRFNRATSRSVHELRHVRDKQKFGQSKKGSKKKQYSCGVCAKNFNSRRALNRHSVMHTEKYKCNTCGKCFQRNADRRKHLRIHMNERAFKCEVCSKCFNLKSYLKDHLLTHSSEKPFSCDTCGKRFKTKNQKSRHALYHLRKE